MPAWLSAWAKRWASRACTPAQLQRISRVETPCAAGSRSRAAATSAPTSETSLFQRLMVRRRVGTRNARRVADDRHHPLAGHLGPGGDLEGRPDVGPGGNPREHALALCREAGGLERVLVGD